MKAKSWLWLGMGAILSAVLLPLTTSAAEVLPVKASLSAISQDEVSGQPKIARFEVTDKAIVNLARGRAPDAAVPANEILALLVNCATREGNLIVFDTTSRAVLAVVADIDNSWLVEDVRKVEGLMLLDIRNVGSPSNKLDGGLLMLAVKFRKVATGCPAKIQASVTGVVHATITDDTGTESVTVPIPKGKMSTRASLGTAPPIVPTPPPDEQFDNVFVNPAQEGDVEQIEFGTPGKDKIEQYGGTGNTTQYAEGSEGDDWILQVGGDKLSDQTAILGEGNDTVYQYGGKGDDTLTINKKGQNFTLVDNNGKVIFKSGDGGSTITVTNIEHIKVIGDDGTIIFQQG